MRAIDTAVINTEFGTKPELAIGRARAETSDSYEALLKELEERAPLYGKLYDFGYEAVRDRLKKLVNNK